MAIPAAALAAAGAAALVYYTAYRERNWRFKPRQVPPHEDIEDEPRGLKRPRGAFPRIFSSRNPDRPPSTCMETASMMAATLGFLYGETLGKWPVADLFLGLAFMWRRRKQSDVGRVFAEDEGSVQLDPRGRLHELQHLRRLVSLCFALARSTYPEILRDFDYRPADILVFEAKAKLLTPAYAVIVERRMDWVLVVLRGTHSTKDQLTCATGASVPFHHTVLEDPESGSDDEAGEEEEDEEGEEEEDEGICEGDVEPSPRKRSKGESGGTGWQPLPLGGRSGSGRGRAVRRIVLGYAHCGMVAAARSIAQRITGLLQGVLRQNPGYTVKVVGHSLGGATAAMLTFILREREGLGDTTCLAFGPAAAMTWDLAESGSGCVTSIVNGADFIPTFSSSSLDDLRSEVKQSAWANDLQEQLHKMRAMRVILRTVSSLKRQVAAMRASTVSMGATASRQLYARLQAAGSTRGMMMALRAVPRGGLTCFRRAKGAPLPSLAAPTGGPDSLLLPQQRLCWRRPSLPRLLPLRSSCQACCSAPASAPVAGPAISWAYVAAVLRIPSSSSALCCARCRLRAASLPLLALPKRRGSVPQGPAGTSPGKSKLEESEAMLPQGSWEAAHSGSGGGGGSSGNDSEVDAEGQWMAAMRAADAVRMVRGEERQARGEDGVMVGGGRGGNEGTTLGAGKRKILAGGRSGSIAVGVSCPQDVDGLPLPINPSFGLAGLGDGEEGEAVEADEEEGEGSSDDAAGLAALLEAMAEPPEESGGSESSGTGHRHASPEELSACPMSWREMEQRLESRMAAEGEVVLTAEETATMEGIIREEQAVAEAALAGGEECLRVHGSAASSPSSAEGAGGEAGYGGGVSEFSRGNEEGEEEEEGEEDDDEDDETRDPRRWYPCGRLIHLVRNTWEPRPSSVHAQGLCSCTDGQGAGQACNGGGQGGGAGEEAGPTWRVAMFETERRLYGRMRLSGSMVSDHLMANYMGSLQALMEEAERDEGHGGGTGQGILGIAKNLECALTCA